MQEGTVICRKSFVTVLREITDGIMDAAANMILGIQRYNL